MKIREYLIETGKVNTDLRACVVSDIHSMPYDKCLRAIESTRADVIICAGDMLERLDGLRDEDNGLGFEFLSKLSKIAPTYYAFGNHELFGSHRETVKREADAPEITPLNMERLIATGVVLVNDDYAEYIIGDNKILIGGLMPADDRTLDIPNIELVRRFSELDAFKILISHQPEYYDEYLKDRDLDLIVSGHTHGGQWKLFGRGVYAPNQGLFPRYSSGIYDKRLVVSAGASNPERFIPRIFNPCEIIILNIKSI